MRLGPETAVAIAGLAVSGAAVATVAGGDLPARVFAGAAAAVALVLPVSAALRTWLLDLHLDRGDAARAVAVARRSHAAALLPRTRARAAVDLALAHLAAGEPAAAAPLLAAAREALPADERARATALLAVTRAHAGAAGAALALAHEAAADTTDDPLVDYAVGLALLAGGDATAALPHLVRGAADPDADLVPSPGERSFALGRAHATLGNDAAADEAFATAARTRPEGPFTRRAAQLLASGPRR